MASQLDVNATLEAFSENLQDLALKASDPKLAESMGSFSSAASAETIGNFTFKAFETASALFDYIGQANYGSQE